MNAIYRGVTLIAIFTISFVFGCTRQSVGTAGNAVAKTFRSSGVVKNFGLNEGRVTIDHKEIEGYMPAMEMTWQVRDRSMLDQLKAGDRVDFEIETGESATIITKLTKSREVVAIDGGEIFRLNCAECHGDKGEGKKKGIPLISGHALNHSEPEYIKQVYDGKSGRMPTFRNKLSEDQIRAVVEFVRGTLQSGVKRDANHHH